MVDKADQRSHAEADAKAAGAPDQLGEFEITPAMVEAGLDAYRALDREFDTDERIVSEIFGAMAGARHKPSRQVSSDRQSAPQSHWWLT